MRKDKLYFFTLGSIAFTVTVISVISVNQLVDTTTSQLLKIQEESSKREALQISKILETQISYGIPKNEVAAGLQRSIENTHVENGFICMYNTGGIEICHPDPSRIGKKLSQKSSLLYNNGDRPRDFLTILEEGKASGGIRDFPMDKRTEIIYVSPVRDTDWMVAAHANISSLQSRVADVKFTIIVISSLASLFIILVTFTIVRWLGSKYERGIESEKDKLVDDLRSIARLNYEVLEYRERVEQQSTLPTQANHQVAEPDPAPKKRVLTYWRDELKSISVDEIAFLYTQNGLTYVHCLTASVYNSGSTLEELFESLDRHVFFRANRQFVISIRAIEKVHRYGNNQLKIVTNPIAPEDILISKNRAAEFKDWLNS